MEKLKYPIWPMIQRLLKNIQVNNKTLYILFTVYTICAFAYPFLGILMPKILIEEFTRIQGPQPIDLFLIVIAYLFIAGVLGFSKTFLEAMCYPKLTELRIDYMREIAHKLFTMDYPNVEDAKFFEKNDFALEATSSNNNGIEGIYHKLFLMPANGLTIIVLTIFIGLLNPFVLVGIVVSIFVSYFISRRVHHYRYSLKEKLSHAERKKKYYNKMTNDFAYGKDIRIYRLKEQIIQNYDNEIIGYASIRKRISNKEYALGFFELIVVLVSDTLTYAILIRSVLHGLSIADFSMYLSAILTLSIIFKQFIVDVSFVVNEGQYVHEFYELMDRNLVDSGGTRKKIEGDTLEVQFDHVSFCYPGSETYILKDFNFTISKGEKLAIVGINGAGKSTIIKLITGLFHPTEGRILINGINIREFQMEEYRQMFSVVFQDINVFAYSVAENVACSSQNIDRERVWDCIDRVGLGQKVRSFDKGIDHTLLKIIDENGTDLSGGEKQKLAIARALYKNANMVILDEPTAALDALAEANIYKSFNDLVKDKTAIYISHRLASTKFCDRIALFDGSGLKEYGTHEELMERKGSYYEMFTVQGKYYREGEEKNGTEASA